MRLARITVAAAVAGVTLLSTTPASASSYWSSSAPKYATKVGTLKTKSVRIGNGGSFTIQLRSGKWGSYSYLWARAPKDSDADSHRIILQVYNPKTGKWDSQSKGIKNTTYSPAHRAIAGRLYKACAKASILGGSPATCTGSWLV
ncbi:hypothetical protein [Nonomuraea harbinensis]|uniref:Uncharacterized protein n=1 Tax=Nonomuraea harbinensis TaxID=1286938 RepID=A0ABW1C447_9ACTN|nr:hypothetical protein [Nonomuraea harbinensis]